MNLFALLTQLSAADAPSAPAAAPRREMLRQLGQAGARVLAAGLPLALATAGPAQARTTDTSLDAVTLLLKLENLLSQFYTDALAAPAFAALPFRADLVLMQTHQRNHATYLRLMLSQAGVPVPAAPTFDFSGRRGNASNPVLFPNVFTDVNSFLELAQQLEDASAAIYKSQAAFVFGNKLLTDGVLRMHSVEARHASHIRSLRRGSGARVKSWPSRNDAAPGAAIQVPAQPAATPASTSSIYAFEANETQIASGARLVPYPTLLTGTRLVQSNALAEAFDEPLPTAQATALLSIFG